MAEETLLTAARRVVRFFNIDMGKGGIITVETQQAVETLDRMVLKDAARSKRLDQEITERLRKEDDNRK